MEILESRQAGLTGTLDGSFPELRTTIWQSEASVQAAVQTLTPQMTENKKKVRKLVKLMYSCLIRLHPAVADVAPSERWSTCNFNILSDVRVCGSMLLSHPLRMLRLQVEDVLREAMVLQEALAKGTSAALLEKLLPKRFKQYQRGIQQRA